MSKYMKTKVCSKCKIEKPFSEFYKGNDKHGLRYDCKSCCSLYYKENMPQIIKRQKQYTKDNVYKVVEQRRRWRKNAIKAGKKQTAYREKHPQKTAKYQKNYRKYHQKEYALFRTYYKKLEVFEKIRCCAGNRELIEVRCAYCGKWLKPTNIQVRNRLQAFDGHVSGENRFYCSNACKQECPTYGQHKYWKGQKDERLGTPREVDAWFRQFVLETDNWTCQQCGQSKNEYPELVLHVHHIQGVAQEPLLQNDINNTVTLCIDCHKKVHQKDGCTYYDLRRQDCKAVV
jgi:hypothetical protein